MVNELYNWFISCARLLTNKKVSDRWKLSYAYTRLYWRKWLGIGSKEFKFLNFKVEFFNQNGFIYLFEEIFMQQTYFFETENQKPVILDAGSNIGMGILYFKWLFPESQILAFEPDPTTFAVLKKNVNGLTNVKIFNCALSNYDGEINFFKNQTVDGTLVMGVYKSRDSETKITVSCQSLGKLIEEKIDLLKMDIEGAEGICLQDIEDKKAFNKIDKIILEVHHNISSQANLSLILPLLEKNHFSYQVSAMIRPPCTQIFAQDVMIFAIKK